VSEYLTDDERREVRWKARCAVLEALSATEGELRRAAVLERALRVAGFSPRELAAPPPESASRRYERLVDHALSWALTNLKRDRLVDNPRTGVWRLSAVARQPVADEAQVNEQRLAELRAMPYADYLRTPEWRRTRAVALLRVRNHCALDSNHTEHLEVHHNTHERLGSELPSDVVVLCHACHRLHHKVSDIPAAPSGGSVPPPGWSDPKPAVQAATADERKPSVLRRLFGS
jgi:restriction endonuclease Mrr